VSAKVARPSERKGKKPGDRKRGGIVASERALARGLACLAQSNGGIRTGQGHLNCRRSCDDERRLMFAEQRLVSPRFADIKKQRRHDAAIASQLPGRNES
jgi:hypothetical protein